jgi:hypothetical protein
MKLDFGGSLGKFEKKKLSSNYSYGTRCTPNYIFFIGQIR